MKPVVHQYEDKLLEFAYGELPRQEAEAVEAHLRGCAKCTEALSHISVVRHTMGHLPMEAAPDAGLESLLAYAEQHAQRNAAGATKRKRPWWQGLVVAFATSAALLVAGVVAFRASEDFNPDPTADLRALDKDKGAQKAEQKKAAQPAPAVANAVAPEGGEQQAAEKNAELKGLEADRLAEARQDAPAKTPPAEEKPQPQAPPSKRGGFGLEDQTVASNWRDASPEAKAKELRQLQKGAKQEEAQKAQAEVDGKLLKEAPKAAPKPVSKAPAKPAEFAKADKKPADAEEGWGGGGKAGAQAGDDALQRESVSKRAVPKKKGKAADEQVVAGLAAKDVAENRNKERKEDERRTEVAAAEPAAPQPAPAQTATASPPPPPVAQAVRPAAQPQGAPGYGVSANEAAGRSNTGGSTTGSGSGGSYSLPSLSTRRAQPSADDNADVAGQAEVAADKKVANADADFYRRKAAEEITTHLELAVKYGNGGQRLQEVKECMEALRLGAAGAQRLEALKRLCDGLNALNEQDQADKYCDSVVLEFPNSAYARQISEARHNMQRAPAPRAAEKSAPMELDETKKSRPSKASKKAVDDAAY